MILIVGSVFQEENKCYLEVYLHECAHEFVSNYKKYAIFILKKDNNNINTETYKWEISNK